MAEARFKNMWGFMADVDYGNGDIGNEMKCVICTRLMINAHNSVCGCRYCHGCVKAYLEASSRKFCPGNTSDCRLEELDLDRNIYPDHPVNQKISKLIVPCRHSCGFRCELINIGDHERACQRQPVNCPYANAGCGATRLGADEIGEHLIGEHELHARLLMGCIGTLQSEIGLMKGDDTRARQTNEMMAQIREEMANLRNENTSLRAEIETFRTAASLGQTNARELALLGEKCRRSEKKLEEIERITRQEKETRINIDKALQKQTKGHEELEKLVREIEINGEMQTQGEFVWRIDDWAAKRQSARKGLVTELISGAFYSHQNGYKMCLSLDPDGEDAEGTHVSVWYHLMRGRFDNILSWPFKRTVTVSLIDQQIRADHICRTFSFDESSFSRNKPTSDRNKGLGASTFIELAEFSRNPGLCQDDRIFIRCVVKH